SCDLKLLMTQTKKDLDIAVFGATGFTGKFVVERICRISNELPGLEWAISGRSESKLQEIFNIVTLSGDNNVPRPEVIIADVHKPDTLQALARRAKVIINCVGPFRFYGEAVVKACIENDANYVDVSGETEFIERIQLAYGEKAKRKNVAIVPACGYDSVPAELGFLFTKRQLEARGAIPSQIEMFSRISGGSNGLVIHYTTYSSLVHSVSNVGALRELRKHAHRPIVPKIGPALKVPPPSKWDSRFQGYVVPSLTADLSVLKLGQQLDIEYNSGVPPAQVASYFVIPKLKYLIMIFLGGAVFRLLIRYEWGKNLLLKHPKFFSFGFFTHEGPSLEQVQRGSFSHRFYARGISKFRLASEIESYTDDISNQNSETLSNLQPDVELITTVVGPEPAYLATSIIAVASAQTLLKERQEIPSGVITPGLAFGKTSLMQ
ncbi:3570_t:CDS:2, partial [Acaulospora morrowiae]